MTERLFVPETILQEVKSKSLPAKGVIFDGPLSCPKSNEGLMAQNDASFVSMMSGNNNIK